MGSNPKGFIPVAEASRILCCSEDRVKSLAHRGLLKWRESGDEFLVDGEDVSAVARLGITDELPGAELIHEMRLLRAKVERLEASVELLFQTNEMAAGRMSGLNLDELAQLHQVISNDLDSSEWPADRMFSYCEIFIRITEEDIDRLNTILGHPHSWEPFYLLLLRISQYLRNLPDLKTSLQLQRIRELLEIGRANMRAVATFFIHASNDASPSKELLSKLASNDIDQFDDLAKQLKAVNPRGLLTPV